MIAPIAPITEESVQKSKQSYRNVANSDPTDPCVHRKLKTSQLLKLLQYSDFFSAIAAIVTIIWKLCYSLHCLNYK